MDPVTLIVGGVLAITDSIFGLVGTQQQRKGEREAFEREFVLSPEERRAYLESFNDDTPLYIVGGLGIAVVIAIIALAVRKK